MEKMIKLYSIAQLIGLLKKKATNEIENNFCKLKCKTLVTRLNAKTNFIQVTSMDLF